MKQAHVAPRAHTEQPEHTADSQCPACGGDPYLAEMWDRQSREIARLQVELSQARASLRSIQRKERHSVAA